MPYLAKRPCSYPGCTKLTDTNYCDLHLDSAVNSWLRSNSGSYYPRITHPIHMPIIMVCGAPASGKSSFVTGRMAPGDVLIDLDNILASQTSQGMNTSGRVVKAIAERNNRLEELQTLPADGRTAWFVICAGNTIDRLSWKTLLHPQTIYIMHTPLYVCISRIESDHGRDTVAIEQKKAATRWWSQYEAQPGEELIFL